MADIDRHIYDQIRDRAGRIDIPIGDVDSVVARGRSRRRLTRATSSVAAAALVGSVAGFVVTDGGSGHARTVVYGPATGSGRSALLSWRSEPVTGGLFMETGLSGPSTGIQYAVSTGPASAGQTVASVLYRSNDGASWSPVTAPTGVSLDGVAVDGNRVYDVGTGTASASDSATVAYSGNGGATWSTVAIPLSFGARNGALTVQSQVLRVAAGPSGVEVGVGAAAGLDLSKLIPGATGQWIATPTGIDVLGSQKANGCPAGETTTPPRATYLKAKGGYAPSGLNSPAALNKALQQQSSAQSTAAARNAVAQKLAAAGMYTLAPARPPANGSEASDLLCFNRQGLATTVPAQQAYHVTSTHTWAQLGVSPDAAQALQGNILLFHSSDGRTFHPVSAPAAQSGPATLTSDGSGFALASADATGAPVVLQSADGVHWTSTPTLPGGSQSSIVGIGQAGGNLMLVMTSNGPAGTVYRLTAGQWVATEQVDNPQSVAFGAAGVAIVTSDSSPSSTDLAYSPDGLQWKDYPLTSLSGGQVGNASVVVNATSVVVTITRLPVAASQPAPQVALIGTPA